MPNNNQLDLTQDQTAELNSLTGNGTTNFAAGYDYISGIVAGNASVDADTQFWFSKAGDINSNNLASAANVFIRSVTESGLQWSGVAGYDIQATSDSIGEAVLSQIREQGGIPQFSAILSNDICSPSAPMEQISLIA